MRIMVIGGGGREHALVWKIAQSPLVASREDLLCMPGNPGIAKLATCQPLPPGGLSDIKGIADAAQAHHIDLTVVGPELPLTLGLVDELARRGMDAFGASAAAARLEGSKVFAKQFMARHGIPTASFQEFSSSAAALEWLSSASRKFPLVVKADGLAAGKGVVVAATRSEAEAAVRAMMDERRFGDAGDHILIEDCLTGTELSFFALTDGTDRVIGLSTCRDYKRVGDGDSGPNTGGMGAYSPSTEVDLKLSEAIMDRIIRPTVSGMRLEGAPYRGVLYAGLMLTGSGPMVLEFNARFGDPETQVLMPRIAGDIVPTLLGSARGELSEQSAGVTWHDGAAACVVVASGGYPGSSDSGRAISGLAQVEEIPDVVVFHAGTRQSAAAAGGPVVQTAGGRVLAVAARAPSLQEAVQRAYRGVSRISFEGMHYRRDIGRSAIEELAGRKGMRKEEPEL